MYAKFAATDTPVMMPQLDTESLRCKERFSEKVPESLRRTIFQIKLSFLVVRGGRRQRLADAHVLQCHWRGRVPRALARWAETVPRAPECLESIFCMVSRGCSHIATLKVLRRVSFCLVSLRRDVHLLFFSLLRRALAGLLNAHFKAHVSSRDMANGSWESAPIGAVCNEIEHHLEAKEEQADQVEDTSGGYSAAIGHRDDVVNKVKKPPRLDRPQ